LKQKGNGSKKVGDLSWTEIVVKTVDEFYFAMSDIFQKLGVIYYGYFSKFSDITCQK